MSATAPRARRIVEDFMRAPGKRWCGLPDLRPVTSHSFAPASIGVRVAGTRVVTLTPLTLTPLTLTPAGSQQDRSIALDTPRATLQLRCPTTRTFDLVPIPSMSISINYATFNATSRSVRVLATGAIVLAVLP